ncbi:MAG: tetratricopeptide repeat protein [Magnetovibrio sp.]|nr:tetratricopeptide repeat protein [Magnetovibrio sp.]
MSFLRFSNQLFRKLIVTTTLVGGLSVSPFVLAAGEPLQIGKGASGNFLAGRHADQSGKSVEALKFYETATSQGRIATASLYRRIYILALSEGRIEDALKALDKAEKAGAKAPFVNLVRSVQAFKDKDYVAAEKLIRDDTGALSRHLSASMVGWAKVGQKDGEGAIKALAPLKANAATTPLYDLHAALIEDALDNTDSAMGHYVTLLKNAGLTSRITQLLGWHLERNGKFKDALELYTKFAITDQGAVILDMAQERIRKKITPPLVVETAQDGVSEALLNIAQIYQTQAADTRVPILAHLALYLRPDSVPAQMVIAQSLETNSRFEEANAIYAKIPRTEPQSWTARLQTALNFNSMGEEKKAIHQLKSLAKEHPQRPVPLIDLGNLLRSYDRYKEAAQAYTDALKRITKIGAHHWGLYYSRGVSYEQSKQWPKAEKDFLKALELKPDQPSVLNYLGYSWIDQGLHLDRALKMIEKAESLRPRDGYIVDSVGWGLYRLGKFDEAVKKLERAVMLNPSDPVINDHLGDALWRVGRTREARFQWERALTLDPDEKVKKDLDEKLKSGLKPLPTK